jgi:autotransporter-associated beta strand protein
MLPFPRPAHQRRGRPAFRPRLEALETRLLPATDVWTGLGFDINNHWTTPSNWKGNVAPTPGDDLVFPAGATQLINFNDFIGSTGGPVPFNSITFTGGGYGLQGNAVILNAGMTDNATNPTVDTVALSAVVLGASQTFSDGTGGGTLKVISSVSLQNFTLTLDGTGTNSVIAGVISGGGSLVKNGTGAWTLAQSNTYTGLTTINAGGLEPDTSLAFGSPAGGTLVNAGGTIILNVTQTSGITFPEPLTLNGDGGAFPGAVDVVGLAADVTTTGAITLGSPSTIVSSVISPNNLVVSGPLNTNGFNITLFGALNLNVTGTVGGGGGVVSNAKVLGGTGTIAVPLLIATGGLSPGINGAPGVLTVATVTIEPGASYAPILAGTTAGAGYSQLQSNGVVNINGSTLELHLNFTPASGDTFVVINSVGAINGTFAGLPNGATFTINGRTFKIFYVTPGQAGHLAPSSQVILEDITAPATGGGGGPGGFTPLPKGVPVFATAADAGGGPDVKVFAAATGTLLSEFFAFAPGFTGGVRVAVGDVNGDGYPDIICAAGPGGGPNVTVFSGKDGTLLASFFAFAPTFTGGVFVAAGDVNGDGFADVICGADQGGGPSVTVFSGKDNFQTRLMSFFAFAPTFTGGVRVAAGDVNGDGKADIIAGAGPGGGPNVTVFSGADGSRLLNFFAFPAGFTNGIYVAAGDLTGAGHADVIAGAGAGGGPNVAAYSGLDGTLLYSFFAYGAGFTGGVRVAAADATGAGHADLVMVPGPGGGPSVRVLDGSSLQQLDAFFALDPRFTGGLYVAG